MVDGSLWCPAPGRSLRGLGLGLGGVRSVGGRGLSPPLMTAAPPLHHAVANPNTATALPQTLIGTAIGAYTWLPPPSLDLPEVVAATLPPPCSPLRAGAPAVHRAVADPKTAAALTQTLSG